MTESKPKFQPSASMNSRSMASASMVSLMAPPLLAGVVGALATAPQDAAAQGAGAIVMQLQGVKGESTIDKYKDWIDLLSYTQSFRNSATLGGGGSTAGKVTCGAITVLKNIDVASPDLIGKVVTGSVIEKGTIVFLSGDVGKNTSEYYEVVLTELLVTSIDQTDQPDASRIVERVTLQPSQFEFQYRQQSASGGPSALTKFSYNCVTGKKV